MSLSQLGFDYSNLVSCTIKRKSHMLALISFILLPTFLMIFLPFLIIYLLGAPVDINGVPTEPDNPAYMEFMLVFLSIFGAFSFLFLALGVVGIINKPKIYMYVDNDPDLNRFYYIYDNRRRQEIYLTDSRAVIYRKSYMSILKENNPNAVKELLDRYVFWRHIDITDDTVIKDKVNKTVLKNRIKLNRFTTKISRFVFSSDINVVPTRVSESITISTGGNSRSQGWFTYYFEDINRKQVFEMHPEIKKNLSEI